MRAHSLRLERRGPARPQGPAPRARATSTRQKAGLGATRSPGLGPRRSSQVGSDASCRTAAPVLYGAVSSSVRVRVAAARSRGQPSDWCAALHLRLASWASPYRKWLSRSVTLKGLRPMRAAVERMQRRRGADAGAVDANGMRVTLMASSCSLATRQRRCRRPAPGGRVARARLRALRGASWSCGPCVCTGTEFR